MNLDELATDDYMKDGGRLNAEWLGPNEGKERKPRNHNHPKESLHKKVDLQVTVSVKHG